MSKKVQNIVPNYKIVYFTCCFTCKWFGPGYFTGDDTCEHKEVVKVGGSFIPCSPLGKCDWFEKERSKTYVNGLDSCQGR